MRHVCRCPNCSQSFQFPDEALGKPIRCPYCRKLAVVRSASSRTTAGSVQSTTKPHPVAPPSKPAPDRRAIQLPKDVKPAPPAPTPKPSYPVAIPISPISDLNKRKYFPRAIYASAAMLGLLVIVLATILVFSGRNRERTEQEMVSQPLEPLPVHEQEGRDPKLEDPVVEPPKPPLPDEAPGNAGDLPADAASEEGNAGGPALVMQIHSLDRVFSDLKTIGGAIGKKPEIEQLIRTLQAPFGGRGLPGIDPNRPWGAYLPSNSSAASLWPVVLVPIRDETDFLRLLHTLQCSTTEMEGIYEVKHAQLPRQFGMRFAHRHAYVASDLDALKKEELIEPKKVFVLRETADARLALRMDQGPKERRLQAFTKLQESLPQIKARIPQTNPVMHAGTEQLIDLLSRYLVDLLEGGRELSLSLRLDSQKQELAADVHFTAVEKSRLAQMLASWEDRPSLFGGLNEGSPAIVTRIHFRLPEELRRIVATLAHEALEQTLKEEKDREKHPADERFVRAFEPTVTAGELDLALFLNSQGRGKPALIAGGLKVVNGAELEKAFRGLVGTLQAPERDNFQLDVGKAAEANLHRLSMREKLPGPALAVFGADPFFYFAFRGDAMLWAAGDNAPESIKHLLSNPSGQVPLALLEMNVKHLLDMIPAQVSGFKGESKAFIGSNSGRLRLSLGGGAVFRLRLDLSILQLLAEMGAIQGHLVPKIEMKSR